jgi:hypothetical protein
MIKGVDFGRGGKHLRGHGRDSSDGGTIELRIDSLSGRHSSALATVQGSDSQWKEYKTKDKQMRRRA